MTSRIVVRHVTLIDGTGVPPLPDATVIVAGRAIEAVLPRADVPPPPGATVVDARGKYLIPGLWDSHVHAFYSQDWVDTMMPLYVALGITGIRDMHGDLDLVNAARRAIADGTRTGPRIIAPHWLLDGDPPIQGNATVVRSVAEARAMVRDRKERGADYVKVYSRLGRDEYFAIADEARTLGMPFAGHVPFSVTAEEASNAGQCAFEHLMGVEMGVCTAEDAQRRRQAESIQFLWAEAGVLRDTFSRRKADALFATLRRNRTWQVPTLVVMRAFATTPPPDAAGDPRMAWVAPSIRMMWTGGPPEFAELLRQHQQAMAALYPFYVTLVGEVHRAGIPILAGSDSPNLWVFPGFALHEELELLVSAGMSEMDVLRSATALPATFLGLGATHGTVEPGKAADLVLLDADPLDNIRNTRKVAAVVHDGRLLDRAALDKLLEESAAAAARPLPPAVQAAMDAILKQFADTVHAKAGDALGQGA